MILNYHYSNRVRKLHLPDSLDVEVLAPKEISMVNESVVVKLALNSPLDSSCLSSFLSDAKHIAVVVNDHERPTPTAKILSCIHEDIKHYNMTFIVASGTHRPPNEIELRRIFGKFYDKYREKIAIHDCRDYNKLTYIGETVFGTSILVNDILIKSDKIIVIGSIEPHYFAGFTGGRKFLLPGTTAYESTEQNHKLALDERAMPLALKGNPVHEDMMDALKLFNRYEDIFSIMTVLNGEHRIHYASAGHINSSFYKGVEVAMNTYCVPIKEKADIVIAIAHPPLDINLYQAHKAIEHAKLALKRNGILILVAACNEGIGPPNFYNLLSSASDPSEVLEKIRKEYRLGYHKAAKIAELQTWAEIWAVTSMSKDILEKIRIKPFTNLQDAIDSAIKLKGKDSKVIILDNAAMIVPKVNYDEVM